MGRRPKHTFLQRRHTDGQQTHARMFNLAHYSVQLLSRVWLFETSWPASRQASLPITNSQSLLKLMSIESVMPFNHLILCRPLCLPSSIFPRIRVFSNESVLRIKWPKYWSFSFSISPSHEHPGLISFLLTQAAKESDCTGLYIWKGLFASGAQGNGASASALPMNIQDWFPLGWTGWISLLCKGLSRVFSNTTVPKHQFFGAQPSL